MMPGITDSPLSMLMQSNSIEHNKDYLKTYENWWNERGKSISNSVDRAATPWLKMFDESGQRIDEIGYEPDYYEMLYQGYRNGVVWRVFEDNDLTPFFTLGYITSYYDPGLYCPYTVSLTTAMPLYKYGAKKLKQQYLPQLLKQNQHVWQGATWMTEIKGGSDLGNNVETTALQRGDHWVLRGDKYFSSNVGAELAIVAARPKGAAQGIAGIALFLLPRIRSDGQLNYTVRRLKNKIATRSVPTGEVELRDAEAYLLGDAAQGIYLVLESLNASRVANSVASMALTQRALAEAAHFAKQRIAFGKPVIQQPLMQHQFMQQIQQFESGYALAWEAVRLLNQVWRETPPYSDQYHLFRLLAHLAKYWTAEIAVQTSKWSMEVHGGLGILSEFPIERCLREAMILSIWEGTSHRQILDALEVMQRKNAHILLFDYLTEKIKDIDEAEVVRMREQIDRSLQLPDAGQQSTGEKLIANLAGFTGTALLKRQSSKAES